MPTKQIVLQKRQFPIAVIKYRTTLQGKCTVYRMVCWLSKPSQICQWCVCVKPFHIKHDNDVTMSSMASQITNPPIVTQPFIQARIKENIKALRHWPLWAEYTGDRWIPRTKGQTRGKCFHMMTSSCCTEMFQNIRSPACGNSIHPLGHMAIWNKIIAPFRSRWHPSQLAPTTKETFYEMAMTKAAVSSALIYFRFSLSLPLFCFASGDNLAIQKVVVGFCFFRGVSLIWNMMHLSSPIEFIDVMAMISKPVYQLVNRAPPLTTNLCDGWRC